MPSRGLLGIYGRVSRVPPHASGGSSPPGGSQIDELEELGDDAIIAQQQAAHVPKPRVQVTEESRSIVISEHPAEGGPSAPAAGKRRSDRTEKTVVIRDRRQVEELRREMARRKAQFAPSPPPAAGKAVWLWVAVGVAAFLMGGLVALFATGEDAPEIAPLPSSAVTVSPAPPPPPSAFEPPSVSIDELPIEGSKKH